MIGRLRPLGALVSNLAKAIASALASVPWRRVGRGLLEDLHVYGGLVLIGTGLWRMHPPTALVVVGLALFAMGLRGSIVPRRRESRG